jgi:CBS domain-containing protein
MTAALVTAKEAGGVFETIRLMRAEAVRKVPIVDIDGSLIPQFSGAHRQSLR